jgi:hypothetical protein
MLRRLFLVFGSVKIKPPPFLTTKARLTDKSHTRFDCQKESREVFVIFRRAKKFRGFFRREIHHFNSFHSWQFANVARVLSKHFPLDRLLQYRRNDVMNVPNSFRRVIRLFHFVIEFLNFIRLNVGKPFCAKSFSNVAVKKRFVIVECPRPKFVFCDIGKPTVKKFIQRHQASSMKTPKSFSRVFAVKNFCAFFFVP